MLLFASVCSFDCENKRGMLPIQFFAFLALSALFLSLVDTILQQNMYDLMWLNVFIERDRTIELKAK